MYTGSILKRTTDGKLFTVTYLAHWSDIQAEDGETVSVKWYGGNKYVSHKNGTYEVMKE